MPANLITSVEPAILIGVPVASPMNSELLTVEYACSPTANDGGVDVTCENFVLLMMFLIDMIYVPFLD